MYKQRQLLLLLVALAIAAGTARGQQDGAAQAEQPAEDTGTPAAAVQPEEDGETESSDRSPYDYRPSEEISEDLSVSFPVDI